MKHQNGIYIRDNFLSTKEYHDVINYCYSASYNYGEHDAPGYMPTGMVHEIDEKSWIYNLFYFKTKDFVGDLKLYRMYVNCFAPSENPHFHIDGDHGITILYYVNDEWNLEMGGETQFLIDDEIRGILPFPNRLVYFDANILHKATSYRSGHRFTLALKYTL